MNSALPCTSFVELQPPALSCLRQQLGDSENPSKKHIFYFRGTEIQPIDANCTEESEFGSKALEYRDENELIPSGWGGPPNAYGWDRTGPGACLAGPEHPWGGKRHWG